MSSSLIVVFFTLQDLLRETMDHDLGPTIAHLLNCFIGSILSVGTKGSDSIQSKGQKKV